MSSLKSQNSSSCFLDGRYFNRVLKDYPGLVKEPVYIVLKERKGKEKMYFRFEIKENVNYPLVARLIIQTPKSRHCNLLIITPGKVYRMEPSKDEYSDKIDKVLETIFPDSELENIEFSLNEQNEECEQSGFCNAYVLMYALAYLGGRQFDPDNIRKFVKKVEDTYKLPEPAANKLEEEPDIEYGFYHSGYHHHYGYGGRNYYGGGYVGGFPLYGAGFGYPVYGYPYGAYPYYGYGYSAPVAAGALVGGLLGGALAST